MKAHIPPTPSCHRHTHTWGQGSEEEGGLWSLLSSFDRFSVQEAPNDAQEVFLRCFGESFFPDFLTDFRSQKCPYLPFGTKQQGPPLKEMKEKKDFFRKSPGYGRYPMRNLVMGPPKGCMYTEGPGTRPYLSGGPPQPPKNGPDTKKGQNSAFWSFFV